MVTAAVAPRCGDRTDSAPTLLPQHQMMLTASAIAHQVAAARGYRSVTSKAELRRLGFSTAQLLVPTLVIPVFSITGDAALYQHRPDKPRIIKGKPIKYETPKGARMVIDVPPGARAMVGDPTKTLFITEGVKKADAAVSHGLCCIGLLGVWNWRGTNEHGGKVALPDWESIALNDRVVFIAFDSDVMLKAEVAAALARVKAFLDARGARVSLIYLPAGPDGSKVGLDDYFAAGHTVDDLVALATTELRQPTSAAENDDGVYREVAGGIVWLRSTREGVVPTVLTNFTATIVSEVIEDDGTDDPKTFFEIETHIKGRERRITVPASRFGAMNWVIDLLGAEAVLPAGFGLRDHARAAIQTLSRDIAKRQVYTHTGWRRVNEQWIYLHAGGALGMEDGTSVETRLPVALARYDLPTPPAGEALVAAVNASLQIIDAADAPPAPIIIPLYAAIFRAVLGPADFAIHVAGPTGVFKSEVAALAQQHWGTGLDARNLPAAWSSTGNSIEALAFHAKNALLVVDDFAPHGTTNDVQRMHREADRLLRAQGNQAGRQRLRSDTTFRPAKAPRGLILSTGEDTPRGQSLRARQLVLEIGPDVIAAAWLTRCQRDAADGSYAQALAAFIAWLAPRYDAVRATWATNRTLLRDAATQSDAHRRTPEIVANLAFGLGWFLAFAHEVGVLTFDACEAIWKRAWTALGEAAAAQAQHQAASEPTRRFLELLNATLLNGEAHLASPDGGKPTEALANALGWRSDTACGARIGWVDGDDLYLEPDAAYAAVQRLARAGGDGFAISLSTLKRRLDERKLLASTDTRGEKRRFEVRRTLSGIRRTVLHLHVGSLHAEEVAQVALSSDKDSDDAPISWATLRATGHQDVAHQVAHENAQRSSIPIADGPPGPPRPAENGRAAPVARADADDEWGEL
jgi:hypothetical protein